MDLPGHFVVVVVVAGIAIDVAVLDVVEDAVELQRMQPDKPLLQSIAIESNTQNRMKMSVSYLNSSRFDNEINILCSICGACGQLEI